MGVNFVPIISLFGFDGGIKGMKFEDLKGFLG